MAHSQIGAMTLNNSPETTPKVGADTMQLLTHKLAMNIISSLVGWDNTLHWLGINLADGHPAEQAVLEGLVVMLDSTQHKWKK